MLANRNKLVYGVYTMDTNLVRVQSYFKPHQVEFLDLLSGKIGVNRSQILRDLAEAVVVQYYKVGEFVSTKPKKIKKNPLLDLVGAEKSKTGTVGLNVDEIYLHD